jgi:hypothetical protein
LLKFNTYERSEVSGPATEIGMEEEADFASIDQGDVRIAGVVSDHPPPSVLLEPKEFIYDADEAPDEKFPRFARCLGQFGDLFRHPDQGAGLIQVISGNRPQQRPITTSKDLSACIIDRLRISVIAGGKSKGHRIPSAEVGSMLKAEIFLRQFRPLDRVIQVPLYLPSWALTTPGYNDGGRGQRFFFAGGESLVYPRPEMICRFLDAMAFKSEADRTNAVAAALTVLLRNHWPGGKPMFPVTANRSHAGKGTVVEFIRGQSPLEQVGYESTDWAFQKAVVTAIQQKPDVGVLNIDNIRLDRRGDVIRSAFLERIVHEAEPLLSSPGIRALQVHNHFVVTATVNDGSFSPDLVNRSVPIRLESHGDLTHRVSAIGDPKGDFLPKQRDRIAGELRGLVGRWTVAGSPLDLAVRHPSYPAWAQTIGGILKVAGYPSFLANLAERQTEDDPVRRSLALLGSVYPGIWLTPTEWASNIANLGLTKTLIPPADLDSPSGRIRGTGVVLSNHMGESLVTETEDERVCMVLQKARRRFEDGKSQWRYCFEVVERRPVAVDTVD